MTRLMYFLLAMSMATACVAESAGTRRLIPRGAFPGTFEASGDLGPAAAHAWLIAGTNSIDEVVRPFLFVEGHSVFSDEEVLEQISHELRGSLALTVTPDGLEASAPLDATYYPLSAVWERGVGSVENFYLTLGEAGALSATGSVALHDGEGMPLGMREDFVITAPSYTTACGFWDLDSNAIRLTGGTSEILLADGHTLVVHCDGSGFEIRR